MNDLFCSSRVRHVTAAALGLSGARAYDVVGATALPPEPRLAIVGSRAAHRRVRRLIPAMVAAARAAGWSVISGGALGIDGDAHRAALVHDVPQLAVLPCGVDRPYPPDHAPLFLRIADGPHSAIVFDLPRGVTPSRSMFASRNSLVVELAQAVVVAQAAPRSGSLGTGRLALRRGRRVLVCSGSHGCAALMALGGERLPVNSDLGRVRQDVAAWLSVAMGDARAPWDDAWPVHLQWLREQLNARGSKGITVDHLPDPLAGLCALSEAEARSLIEEVSPGRFVAAR